MTVIQEIKQEVARLLENFLAEASADYIGLYEIMASMSKITGINQRQLLSNEDSDKLLQAVLAFVILMLSKGFEVVNLVKGGHCTAWPDQEPQAVAQKIAAAWKRVPNNPASIGFEIWFNKIKGYQADKNEPAQI